MEFKNLGIAYLKTTDGLTGSVSIFVDGNEVLPVTGDFVDGWGDYAAANEIYDSDQTAKHIVTVTVDEGEAKNFQILCWLLS